LLSFSRESFGRGTGHSYLRKLQRTSPPSTTKTSDEKKNDPTAAIADPDGNEFLISNRSD